MTLYNSDLGASTTAALLAPHTRLHFVGVGGVQMSALAMMAHARGIFVTGSDIAESATLRRLRRAGLVVHGTHDAAHVVGCDALVYSLAVGEDNPEYRAATALGIPTVSRAELLAALTAPYPCRVAVAGSHGKSSVTAMLAHVLTCAGLDPTVIGGAPLVNGSALREGGHTTCVMEACEYRDSFLALSPTLGLLLSFDLDHTDYFPDEAALARSFARFAGRCDTLILNGEDATLAKIGAQRGGKTLTFGVDKGDAHAQGVRFEKGLARFTLVLHGAACGEVSLRVAGRHNLQNALAAALAAHTCGVGGERISAALSTFAGLARRMEYRGLFRGARVIDDYAHHPREISAVLDAVRKGAQTGRVFAVFQPHTYSRTAALLPALAAALRAADRVIVTPIFAAREKDTLGVDGAMLADAVGAHATYAADFPTVAAMLSRELDALDTLVVMGAGDTHRLFPLLGL